MISVTQISIPTPPSPDSEDRGHECRKPTIEEKVQYLIHCVQSHPDPTVEWLTLRKFYRKLEGRTDPRSTRLREMLNPLMASNGYYR